jgi:hypothetical protein
MTRRWQLKLLACLTVAAAGIATADGQSRRERGQRSRGGMRQRMMRDDGAPKVGEQAPAFKIKTLADQSKQVDLEGFKGKRPVVLFFGSYT